MFLSEWREFPSAPCMCSVYYSGADKSLARPGRKQANVSVRMAWISFGSLPCRKRNLMTARVSMLLKSRASLTCFRSCFLPGRAKDLPASWYIKKLITIYTFVQETQQLRIPKDSMWHIIRSRYYDKWHDMISYDMIYLLNVIGLTPSGSSAVHIYTQTVHRTTQLINLVGRLSGTRTQSGQTKWEECGPCLESASDTLSFAL